MHASICSFIEVHLSHPIKPSCSLKKILESKYMQACIGCPSVLNCWKYTKENCKLLHYALQVLSQISLHSPNHAHKMIGILKHVEEYTDNQHTPLCTEHTSLYTICNCL